MQGIKSAEQPLAVPEHDCVFVVRRPRSKNVLRSASCSRAKPPAVPAGMPYENSTYYHIGRGEDRPLLNDGEKKCVGDCGEPLSNGRRSAGAPFSAAETGRAVFGAERGLGRMAVGFAGGSACRRRERGVCGIRRAERKPWQDAARYKRGSAAPLPAARGGRPRRLRVCGQLRVLVKPRHHHVSRAVFEFGGHIAVCP